MKKIVKFHQPPCLQKAWVYNKYVVFLPGQRPERTGTAGERHKHQQKGSARPPVLTAALRRLLPTGGPAFRPENLGKEIVFGAERKTAQRPAPAFGTLPSAVQQVVPSQRAGGLAGRLFVSGRLLGRVHPGPACKRSAPRGACIGPQNGPVGPQSRPGGAAHPEPYAA